MKASVLGIASILGLSALVASSSAMAGKAELSAAFMAKSTSAGEIASALDQQGKVRVVVVVKVPGQTAGSIATLGATGRAKVGTPAEQVAVKRSIRAAVDRVVASLGMSESDGLLKFSTVPAFAAEMSKSQIERLARNPNVTAINYDMPMSRQLDVSLPFDGVPPVHSRGGSGSGRAVVVIDDGVQRDHPFLGTSRLVSGLEACFAPTNSCPNNASVQVGVGAGAAVGTAEHGTHVAGIVLGSRPSGSPLKGNAPSAKLIPINIFGTSQTTSYALIQRAFEQAETWVGATNPSNIAAISMSVGGGFSVGACDSDPNMQLLKPVVDRLRAKGILSVVAAGNDGSRNGMSFPACLSSIVSVGAIKRNEALVSSYSNVGATTDLLAPGGDFDTGCVVSSVRSSGFGAKCGTSMATPQVSGIIAALKTLAPSASADAIEMALKNTGLNVPDQRSGGMHTKKRVRADLALNSLLGGPRPLNDSFAGAVVIPSRNITMQGSNANATLEAGERRHVVPTAAASVWWKITPGVSGPITVDTVGSSFDTVLAVYSGATNAGNGVPVVQNDNVNGGLQSSVTFNAAMGTTYHIAVAGKTSSATGSIALRTTAPAVNNNFPGVLVGVNCCGPVGGVSGNNFLTTREAGEPNHAGRSSTSSVWGSFQAAVSGPIVLDTRGSDFDTLLAVYTGSSVGRLTPVAANDDADGLTSRVSFNATAGTTYRVAIAGFASGQGNWRLNWSLPGAFSATFDQAEK